MCLVCGMQNALGLSGRFYELEGSGEILLPDGGVAAEGRGEYVKMGIEAIAGGGMAEGEWLADGREVPDAVEFAPEEPKRD